MLEHIYNHKKPNTNHSSKKTPYSLSKLFKLKLNVNHRVGVTCGGGALTGRTTKGGTGRQRRGDGADRRMPWAAPTDRRECRRVSRPDRPSHPFMIPTVLPVTFPPITVESNQIQTCKTIRKDNTHVRKPCKSGTADAGVKTEKNCKGRILGIFEGQLGKSFPYTNPRKNVEKPQKNQEKPTKKPIKTYFPYFSLFFSVLAPEHETTANATAWSRRHTTGAMVGNGVFWTCDASQWKALETINWKCNANHRRYVYIHIYIYKCTYS